MVFVGGRLIDGGHCWAVDDSSLKDVDSKLREEFDVERRENIVATQFDAEPLDNGGTDQLSNGEADKEESGGEGSKDDTSSGDDHEGPLDRDRDESSAESNRDNNDKESKDDDSGDSNGEHTRKGPTGVFSTSYVPGHTSHSHGPSTLGQQAATSGVNPTRVKVEEMFD
ncbi:Hypothetical predicted protein [Olea europaea subsp. europaea]|uniref:Uncharacterized protein n=1 Tax=Olea europaea subsp. europaea TaxID=158383 RepID=A0A8S0UJU6_OLEEU|nr:Hypothetical predicted protein [Olea europaea subsp. europaea]